MQALTRLAAAAILCLGSATVAAEESMIQLATESGCFICHTIYSKNDVAMPLAPPYIAIADRYRGREDAFGYLTARVLHGTAYTEQNWTGATSMRFMPPNVNVNREDAGALVNWILKLESDINLTDRFSRHESMLATATTSGCFACHRLDPSSDSRLMPLAPSLKEIAARYRNDAEAAEKLYVSVKQGTQAGAKKWHNSNMQFMPPNVALAPATTRELIAWILQLR